MFSLEKDARLSIEGEGGAQTGPYQKSFTSDLVRGPIALQGSQSALVRDGNSAVLDLGRFERVVKCFFERKEELCETKLKE